jgi:hypothetical protein
MGYFCDNALGINLHTCLAVTPEGLVLGVLDQSASTRPEENKENRDDTTAHEKKRRDISEKESYRWLETMQRSNAGIPPEIKVINVCDREGDMYELFEAAHNTGKIFLVRVAQNRLTTSNEKIIDEIKKREPAGKINVAIPRNSRKNTKARAAVLDVSFATFDLKRPGILSNKKGENSIKANVIYVKERIKAAGSAGATETTETIETTKPSEPIESPVPAEIPSNIENDVEWILITNDTVESFDDACEKINYYVQRWKIERFHYVLKSGCQVERLQERTYEKMVVLLSMYSVIAIFLLNMTYLARVAPDAPCTILLNEEEWKVLYCAANRVKVPP